LITLDVVKASYEMNLQGNNTAGLFFGHYAGNKTDRWKISLFQRV
jgi:hypothetical protein